MPHPKLIAWQKRSSGVFALGKAGDSTYHLLSDLAGRKSLHELLRAYDDIDYVSSVRVPLDHPPTIHVDANIARSDPAWLTEIRITSGGQGCGSVTFQDNEGTTFLFDRFKLAATLSKPNLGYDEVYFETPRKFCVW